MKTLFAVVCLVLVAGCTDPVRDREKDYFFAQLVAPAPNYLAARSIFTPSETPMVVVSGKGFEGCELRFKFWRGERLIGEKGPVRITLGSFYAVKLPDIAPGVFRVQVLRNGEAMRELTRGFLAGRKA
jgi:hypothetical protein